MERLERVILQAVSLLLLGSVIVATALLYFLFFRRLWDGVQDVSRVADLQHGMQHVFAGVLTIMIGLEVLETLREYSRDHHVRLRIVFAVAGIAVARHIIQLDFEQIDSLTLIGLGVLVAALGAGYSFCRRATIPAGRLSDVNVPD